MTVKKNQKDKDPKKLKGEEPELKDKKDITDPDDKKTTAAKPKTKTKAAVKPKKSAAKKQVEQAESNEDAAAEAGADVLYQKLGLQEEPEGSEEQPVEYEEPDYGEQDPEPYLEEEPPEDEPTGYEEEEAAWDPNYGRKGVIDEEAIAEAKNTYDKYKSEKEKINTNIKENEQWWQLKQWEVIGDTEGKENDPKPVSAWMFNSLANKHADVMDNFPAPNLLPREMSDQAAADSLSKIVPCILDGCDFEQVYSDAWWYKLKQGFCAYATYWDSSKDNGAGDIAVKFVDMLNLFWEPGIKYIQDSSNIFLIEAVDNDVLESLYPDLEGTLANNAGNEIVKYDGEADDSASNRSVVYDWYYKQSVNGKTIVQYCKFIEGTVLFASENCDEFLESGYYESGEYPFVIDNLFPVENSLIGFGYIDVMKSPQMYVNKLDQIIMKNAAIAGKPRYAIKKDGGLPVEQFADFSNDVIEVTGKVSDDNFRQLNSQPLPAYVVNHLERKIDELKETSGNRDFSQGSTAAGVTAASAIAALQEAGSKLSRDMIKSSYRAYTSIVKQIVDLIRQFYDEPRCFRIDGKGGTYEFINFDNSAVKETEVVDETGQPLIVRKPIFDIKISAAKQNAFNRASQNENAKELYKMGAFVPQNADQASLLLSMMDFEGIEDIKKKVQDNGTLASRLNQAGNMAMQLAQMVDQMMGTQYTAQMQAALTGQPMQAQLPSQEQMADQPGISKPMNTRAANIKERAASQAEVNGDDKGTAEKNEQ